ncbi:hypothetical protein WHY64_00055 [Clostridium perfringens]|uniref:hypothetical protein n=1 Tax=Clostridium perfringens TaxID=1502 RepID=UPI0018AA5AAB|nr:hypothetical protein [Clostridium perfringens]WEV15649.1 hypothetical protein PL325_13430 [Clostridium perfringens D]EGT5618955.1 hypothetical protein [Clostridium perfringens]EHK2336338.1 hypothetical protein [Clostridium perfringens]ELC8414515.1 hypothetical protein [Clostridium perfringens]ELC8419652.1 hypothetical protein [Clostridium perfringens]
MNLEELKNLRLKELDIKYKPIIKDYNDNTEIVNSITIESDDTIDIIICKLYILTNNVAKTLKLLTSSEYRINNRKITSTDISQALKNINKSETNPIKLFAKKQYINNKKRCPHI